MVDLDRNQDPSDDGRPYASIRRLGPSLVFGGLLPVDEAGRLIGRGDIEAQTHAVFRNLRAILDAAGMRITDLVRLNTYYIGDVPESEATPYWERMTRVRLEYLELPGPAAMAVRVNGTGIEGALIELEGEAIRQSQREDAMRIMPAVSWDWSIPVPLSQGWRVGNRIWVGGQISADQEGRAVHPGDPILQTRQIMTFIRHVLEDVGAGMGDLCHLKICYHHAGDGEDAECRLRQIMEEVGECCGTVPPVTAFGANLLYGGLVLEIDAAAVIGASRRALAAPDGGNCNWAAETYAVRKGGHIQFAGYSPPLGARDGVVEAVRSAARQFAESLERLCVSPATIARLNVFHCAANAAESGRLLAEVTAAAQEILGDSAPPITLVRCAGLPGGSRAQIDGYCLAD